MQLCAYVKLSGTFHIYLSVDSIHHGKCLNDDHHTYIWHSWLCPKISCSVTLRALALQQFKIKWVQFCGSTFSKYNFPFKHHCNHCTQRSEFFFKWNCFITKLKGNGRGYKEWSMFKKEQEILQREKARCTCFEMRWEPISSTEMSQEMRI